jgi:hypothetical protein
MKNVGGEARPCVQWSREGRNDRLRVWKKGGEETE